MMYARSDIVVSFVIYDRFSFSSHHPFGVLRLGQQVSGSRQQVSGIRYQQTAQHTQVVSTRLFTYRRTPEIHPHLRGSVVGKQHHPRLRPIPQRPALELRSLLIGISRRCLGLNAYTTASSCGHVIARVRVTAPLAHVPRLDKLGVVEGHTLGLVCDCPSR